MKHLLERAKIHIKDGFRKGSDESQRTQTPTIAPGPSAFTVQDSAQFPSPAEPPVPTGSDPSRTIAGEDVITKEPQPQSTPGTTQLIAKDSASPATDQFEGGERHPAIEPNGKDRKDRSTELWHDAYEELEAEVETAKIFNVYTETLAELLTDEELKLKAAEFGPNPSTAKLKVDPAVRKNIRDKIQGGLKHRSHRLEYMTRFVKEGQDKVARASKRMQRVGKVADAILEAKPVTDIVLQVPQAAPAALPWAGVCLGLKILAKPANARKSNLDGISTVSSRLDWYSSLCYYLLNGNYIKAPDENVSIKSIQEQLEKRVLILYKAILFYQMKSVCMYYKHQGLVFLQDLSNWNDWDGYLKAVTDAQAALEHDSNQYHRQLEKLTLGRLAKSAEARESELRAMHQDLQQAFKDQLTFHKNVYQDEKDRIYFEDIHVVFPEDIMGRIERKRGGLLNDAFSWIFDAPQYISLIDETPNESRSHSQLLWIKGTPGMGKTMLVIGIIHNLSNQLADLAPPSLSYYFCQGTDDQARNNATSILRSLIWMLLAQQPNLMEYLRAEHQRNHSDKIFDDNKFALEAVTRVFESMLNDVRPVYLIVDGLDECDQDFDVLIQIMATSLQRSKNVKWLVSSRPNIDVLALLKEQGVQDLEYTNNSLDLNTQKLEAPVNAYVEHKLSALKNRPGYSDVILQRVSNEISGRKEKTFLWVALVFERLDEKDDQQKPPNGIYALEIIKEMPPDLLELYDHLMVRIEKKLRKDSEYCKNILTLIAVARRPLSFGELAIATGLRPNKDLEPKEIVEKCGSFLTTEADVVYLIHQSAKEYLQNDLRDPNKNHPQDLDKKHSSRMKRTIVEVHRQISCRSVEVLSTHYNLRQNQSTLEAKFLLREEVVPLEYFCLYWIDHLHDAIMEIPEAQNRSFQKIHELCEDGFKCMNTFFLQWLENLSLLHKVVDGIISMEVLLKTMESSGTSSEFTRLLDDAEKFAIIFRSLIEGDPSRVYSTALAFSPINSIVKNLYWKQRSPWIKSTGGSHSAWGPLRHVLWAHGKCNAMAFSPDGTVLASSLDYHGERTVQLWDVKTAAPCQTLKDYPDKSRLITFSMDGQSIATVLEDSTIDIRKIQKSGSGTIETGIQRKLKGSTKYICSAAFSADGSMLATCSFINITVQLWNLEADTIQFLEGHTTKLSSVAFSTKGLLASAEVSGSIRLWNDKSGAFLRSLKSKTRISSIKFSYDGTVLASVIGDEIELWRLETDAEPQTLEGQNGEVLSVAFSRDGTMLASSYNDHTVQLWNVQKGFHRQILKCHGECYSIMPLAFLVNDWKLASASPLVDGQHLDFQVAEIEAVQQRSTCHSDRVHYITFSMDGTMIASVSNDSLRLWDVETGSHQRTIEPRVSDSEPILTVKSTAYSPDGTKLAGAGESVDQYIIWVWDLKNHEPPQLVKTRGRYRVDTLVFSANNQRLVCFQLDSKEILLLDFTECKLVRECPADRRGVKEVVFSTDNQLFASIGQDPGVKIWSADSGELIHEIQQFCYFGKLLSFSGDKSHLNFTQGTVPLDTTAKKKVLQFTPKSSSRAPSTFKMGSDWIYRDGKRLLRLPDGFNESWVELPLAAYQDTIALGSHSGDVWIIKFLPEAMQLV